MTGEEMRFVVFDFFGTLFDISGMEGKIGEITGEEDPGGFLEMWRRKQLEYTYLLTIMGRYELFLNVTGRALRYTASALGVDMGRGREDKLMDLWLHPSLYSDVGGALEMLSGENTAILSNGDPAMLDAGVKNAGISHLFRHVLSVDEAGVFKPHREAYDLAVKWLETDPGSITFVSSNGWDIAGASSFGFRTVWLNRTGLPVETLDQKPTRIIGSLTEL